MTIRIEPMADDVWLVEVESESRTEHRVRVTEAEAHRITHGSADTKQLLEASFRFLLEREPNTSILREFDLSVISRYFPEYEREIVRYLARE